MGCDIHLFQEKRINGKWVAADNWVKSPYDEDDEDTLTVPWDARLYSDRNYRVFAVLADVRNGYGFAGVSTGEAVKPISPPRGVPIDCCVEYLREVEGWGVDGHSHSWLTLQDLTSYDWDQPRVNYGVVDVVEYFRWKASGDLEPRDWCGDIFGKNISIVTEAEAKLFPADSKNVYVRARWITSVRDDCRDFLDVVLPRLRELEAECGENTARIVFFFDN